MEQSSDGMQLVATLQDEHFQASTKAQTKVKATKQTARRNAKLKRLKSSHEQLHTTRGKLLTKRAEFQLHLESLSDSLIRTLQAQHEFIDEAERDSRHPLYMRNASFENVSASLQDQVEDAMRLMQNLKDLEGDLEAKDANFVVDAEEVLTSLPVSMRTEKRTSKPERKRSRGRTPSPRSKYFSRAGDVKIWMERIQDLDTDYMDLLTERDIIIDRGEGLQLTDEQVLHEYDLKRKALLSELAEAERDRDLLKSLCTKLNLNINPRQGARSESSTKSVELKDLEARNDPEPRMAVKGTFPDHLVVEEPLLQSRNHQENDDGEKVWSWINDVDGHEHIEPHEGGLIYDGIPHDTIDQHPEGFEQIK